MVNFINYNRNGNWCQLIHDTLKVHTPYIILTLDSDISKLSTLLKYLKICIQMDAIIRI